MTNPDSQTLDLIYTQKKLKKYTTGYAFITCNFISEKNNIFVSHNFITYTIIDLPHLIPLILIFMLSHFSKYIFFSYFLVQKNEQEKKSLYIYVIHHIL